ncbi:flagellar hook assembly protein FlgD [Sphingomonas jatrophae]|uniref:Basal-body rod modification protein FlgD n=1 Tax=Sphingomonas jatrophae TaxID=1166337 RepID=A0A1I6MAX3_9SPHN|nr:flagellar hook capping FlgD N-terminal domain-containing protein [Sphingomonas jatrophae]SFS12801.1 flagellar basal-body rod modification protein FlgD [Sphingomonas jatrophae]
MTTVNPTDTLSIASATTKKSSLGQEDFLKLMTTQLKTQDPFDPVDNSQMVAQMAQFSSVAGIAEMNQSLKSIVDTIGGSRIGDAAGWIGKGALVPSDTAGALGDGSYRGEVTLDKAATGVTLSLVDANGAVQHSENLGAQPSGTVQFQWDGKDAQGKAVAGPLKVVVNATATEGKVTPAIATWTGVTGVQSPASGATKLVTPIGTFDPADVQRLG